MLNVRVSPSVKQQAEDVLKQLGIPMATAIDMYLRQITLTGAGTYQWLLPLGCRAASVHLRLAA